MEPLVTTRRKRPSKAEHSWANPAAIPTVPLLAPLARARVPSRPTRARLQTYFLRRLAVSGSVAEAAAQAATTPRTVQRWRLSNPAFARRYEMTLATRLELLEDLAMRRAMGADPRPVFRRGKQIATVERHNDTMLMRLLARFDRLRERHEMRASERQGELDIAMLDAAGERARHRDFQHGREE